MRRSLFGVRWPGWPGSALALPGALLPRVVRADNQPALT